MILPWVNIDHQVGNAVSVSDKADPTKFKKKK